MTNSTALYIPFLLYTKSCFHFLLIVHFSFIFNYLFMCGHHQRQMENFKLSQLFCWCHKTLTKTNLERKRFGSSITITAKEGSQGRNLEENCTTSLLSKFKSRTLPCASWLHLQRCHHLQWAGFSHIDHKSLRFQTCLRSIRWRHFH